LEYDCDGTRKMLRASQDRQGASRRTGASGFLLRDATAEELLPAVRAVAHGGGLLEPAVTRRVVEAFAATPAPGPALWASSSR
jgi:DNA-binding NarL/FixJ family response regulator